MRLPEQLFGMRWWLGLAFAAVAGLTAVAVVTVVSGRTDRALRAHMEEFAVGNTVGAAVSAKSVESVSELRTEIARIAAERGLALFAFDRSGRLLTAPTSEAVAWSKVPGGRAAVRTRLAGGRYIEDVSSGAGSAFVVGVRVYGGPAFALVGYSRHLEFQTQLNVVRGQFLRSALIAFAIGAGLGLLLATLTARRLARIAGAAKAIGAGDFSVKTSDRFPDEVGSLALSIEQMRVQLQELFDRIERDRDRLESLLDRLNEGVLLVDRELNVEFANDRARELLDLGDLAGSPSRLDTLADRRPASFAQDLFGARLPGSLRIEHGERTLVLTGIPPGENGETAIVVVFDESERDRNERAQREFATNAAHELRTPLASIVTAVEMLQTGAKDEPAARDEFLEVIRREADRLTLLTRALLVLARAEAGEEAPHLTSIRVAPLLEQVAASLPVQDGVKVAVDCLPTVTIVGHADLLEQALRNLATNAARHTSVGSISLHARRENGSVVIEVADTGIGIPPDQRARIFDRFYRGSEREDGLGFGLGLAIARESVRTLGGEIELGPEQPVGTTVRVTLAAATPGKEEG
jgi:two-component system sensor histidine kinase VicK